MYSKPLAARMGNGPQGGANKTSFKAPLSSAGFASYLPAQTGQGAIQGSGPQSARAKDAAPLEQAAGQGNLGLNQMKAFAALASVNAEKAGPAATEDAAQPSAGLPLHPRDLFKLLAKGAHPNAKNAETAVRVKPAHKKDVPAKDRVADVITRTLHEAAEKLRQNPDDSGLGKLAAGFESGKEGIAAIGYDRHGGTSYGKYQLSSRAGTMAGFITYLQTEEPDMAATLRRAGAANTGGKQGKMPAAWKEIAEENPERFEELQDKFIRASHFEPAMRAIAEKTGFDRADMPFALREVVFSTAVQHGPDAASRIIAKALGQVGEKKLDPEENAPETVAKAQENLIRKIYQSRSGQFQSSAESVQAAVKSRLRQEMSLAISMLRAEHTATGNA